MRAPSRASENDVRADVTLEVEPVSPSTLPSRGRSNRTTSVKWAGSARNFLDPVLLRLGARWRLVPVGAVHREVVVHGGHGRRSVVLTPGHFTTAQGPLARARMAR